MRGRKKHYLEKYLFWMIELWSEYLLQTIRWVFMRRRRNTRKVRGQERDEWESSQWRGSMNQGSCLGGPNRAGEEETVYAPESVKPRWAFPE